MNRFDRAPRDLSDEQNSSSAVPDKLQAKILKDLQPKPKEVDPKHEAVLEAIRPKPLKPEMTPKERAVKQRGIEELKRRTTRDFDPEKVKTATQLGRESGWSLEDLPETGDNVGRTDTGVDTSVSARKTAKRRMKTLGDEVALHEAQAAVAVGDVLTLEPVTRARKEGLSLEGLEETGMNAGKSYVEVDTKEEAKRTGKARLRKLGETAEQQAAQANIEGTMARDLDVKAAQSLAHKTSEEATAKQRAEAEAEANAELNKIMAEKRAAAEAEANAETTRLLAERAAEHKKNLDRYREDLKARLDKGAADDEVTEEMEKPSQRELAGY